MKKRILALFLAGIMTFTMAPAESFAAAPVGEPAFEESGEQAEDRDTEETIQPETPEQEEPAQPEVPGQEENTQPETPKQEEDTQPETPEEVLQPGFRDQEESIQPEVPGQEENTQPEMQEDDTEESSKQGTDSQEKKELEDVTELTVEEELSPEEMLAHWKAPAGGMMRPEGIKVSNEEVRSLGVDTVKKNSDGEYVYESALVGSQQYNSAWDIYSSNYIYNNLTTEEKAFWDALDKQARKYLTGTANAYCVQSKEGNEYCTDQMIDYSVLGFDSASELYQMFCYSNPQYYFLEGFLYVERYIDGEYVTVMAPRFYADFASGSSRKSATAKMKAQIDAAQKQIAKGKNEAEKAKIAHDWILAKVTYDPGFNLSDPSGGTPYTPYHQSAYSVFCDDYTVCAGYTKAFEMLMNGAGIDTIGVTSTGHAWNMVSINDSWYHVDCTWDDSIVDDYGEKTCYMYFNRSQAKMTGSLDQDGMHQMESFQNGLIPKSTLDSGATLTSPGKCKTPSSTTSAPKITQKAVSGDKIQFTLSSSTSGAEIYYTVDGKKPSSSFTKGYRYRGTFKVKKGTTVKAIAVRDTKKDSSISSVKAGSTSTKTYTVKFNTMGGSKIASKKVNANSKVKQPSNPKRAKYAFAGWYSDKNYKNKWDFKKKVTKNITLYAKWKKVKVERPSINSLANVSGKKMKVKIKKVSGAKGYQIRYSTSSKLKSAQKITTKSTTKTISKLKKKTYYVQVRAYKADSAGNRVYGSWSKTKKIKIRK